MRFLLAVSWSDTFDSAVFVKISECLVVLRDTVFSTTSTVEMKTESKSTNERRQYSSRKAHINPAFRLSSKCDKHTDKKVKNS